MPSATKRKSHVKQTVFILVLLSAYFLSLPRGTSRAQVSGLVAAYNFNTGSGTTLTDVSGNNLTGTIVGATWTTAGKYGNALSFNGSSSYVDLGNPASLQLTGSMTLEAWIKAAANPPDDGQIIAKADSAAGWQFKTSPDTGPHTFGVQVSGSSTTWSQRYSTTARSLNTWYHVTATFDASAGTLNTYVNGVLDNGTLRGNAVPFSQFNQNVNVNIGRRTGGFYFNGIIDEVRIYNRALSQSEIQIDMNTPVGGTPPPPDGTPPTVLMTAPVDGATVSGTVSISANASDNVGVAGVQFKLDGNNLGTEVTAAPFTYQWNSALASLGPHSVSAVARDFAGNTTTSTGVSVSVTNPTAAQVGQWSEVMNWPIVAVHASLLPSGDVLAWTDYTTNEGAQLWRRATNTFIAKTYDPVSLFCAAHTFLPDGRLLVAGGITGLIDDLGPRDAEIFDPATETWGQAGLMSVGRYYPTTTTLPDGRVLVQGGTTTCLSCIADIPEIYNPVTNVWTRMNNSARLAFQYYPHAFVLPNGKVLVTSQDSQAIPTSILDLTTQLWTTVDSRVLDGHSAAMYLPGKILKAGTATADHPGSPSARTAYVLDMTQASPAWQATAQMAFPRSFLNLTVLPDGQVLATGGSVSTDPANFADAVYEAELWSPGTGKWTTMSRMQTPRLYHSTALLLPDATVLVAGGGRQNGRSQPDPHDEPNAEIFSPPYLFKGPRPAISSAPSLVQYGNTFFVATPDSARIASAAFIAPGAVTHAFNENQRFVPVTFDQVSGGLNVHAPADGNIAPPGPYMLFIVDTSGVPSVAAWTRLPAPGEDSQPPSAPGSLNASASVGSINLTWTAATDNVGVTGYNVHRSTTSGFTPSAANKIGQTSTPGFVDTNFPAAGTYYYLVTAQDARGNVGSPSNEALGSVAADDIPPTISMTAPASGATVSGSVTIAATASDNVAVAGVQFLLDGASLGNEVTGAGPTYTLNWNTVLALNGPHTLSARARDGAGNTAGAGNVSVTLSNSAPSGLVAAYSFSETSGTVVNDVSGNGLNGTIVGATRTSTGKYGGALSFNGSSSYVDLGNPAALQLTGSMTIEAWVNAAGNPPDDGQIVAKADNSAGWQFKTSPDTGPHTFGFQVSGSSTAYSQRYSTTVRSLNTWYHFTGVYDATAKTLNIYVNGVLVNGTLRGSAVPASQFNQNVNVNIGRRSGGYYFNGMIDEVRIYSRALSQAEIQFDMNAPISPPDTTAPTVSMSAPLTGATLNGAVTITASASDNIAMAGLQFLLDGANLGAEVTGPGPIYSYTWNSATAGNGPHNISARARDTSNNTAPSDIVNVTVDNPDVILPIVSISAPVAGTTATGSISIIASATDNVGMAGVQFLLNGTSIGPEITGNGPTYTYTWDTTLSLNGPSTLTASARDTSNNIANSAAIPIVVSNGDVTPPTVAITTPTAGATVSGVVTVSATTTDNVATAGVQFLLDGANLGTEITGIGPTYTFNWSTASSSSGPHTLSARARDGAGNTALAPNVGVTVSNAIPTGLIAGYSFSEGTGTTTRDSSTNGITGTLSGATWTAAGKYGNALSFSGNKSFVNLANPMALRGTGSMSWTAWVKATGTPTGDGDIISKSNATSGWQFKTSPFTGPQTFAIAVSSSAGYAQRYSNTVRALNTWYHVAGVYNAATRTLDIYVNGVLDNGVLQGTVPAAQTVPSANVNIGRRSTGFYFIGVLDEVQVYNRALSQSEIQTIMNRALP